ncbi:unnamed protein product, partial [Rotaria sp. Silwood1]
MARIIDPKNIISLIFSNENEEHGQIQLFLSHFRIHEFIRLRSLSLFKAKDEDLNEFQHHIMKYPLRTFSISSMNPYSGNTSELLSYIISQDDLVKLEFDGSDYILSWIEWPIS